MAKAAIVILAGTESHTDLGRLANGLEAAKEFQETDGDEVKVIFDGAGTQWVPELEGDHDYSALYETLKENVYVCDYCAGAFQVEESVEEAGLETLAEFEGHPSIRDLVADDYEVITF